MKKRLLTVLLAVCLVVALGTVTAMADGRTAEVGDESQLRDAIANNNEVSITLTNNITLTGTPLTLTSGKNITINGMNYAINFDGVNVKTAFTGSTEGKIEGVPAGVTLTVNNVKFNSTGEGSNGYAVLVGSDAFNTVITLNNCEFIGLYSGVYSNGVFEAPGEGQSNPVISITNGIFTDTEYGTSVDNVTNGTVNDGTNVTIANPKYDDTFNEHETWDTVVASVTSDGVTKNYKSLSAAIQAAVAGDTVTLEQEVTETTISISEDKNISLNLGGNTLNLTQFINTGNLFGSSSFKAMFFNAGTLSIENGRIVLYNSTEAGNGIVNSGNMTLASDLDIDANVMGEALINVDDSLTSYADISNIVTTPSRGWGGAITTYGGILNLYGGSITAEAAESAGSGLNITGLTVYNSEYNNTSEGAEVTLSNVNITADVYAISTNNLYSGGNNPSNVTINSGSLTSTRGTAVYWPSAGTLTVGVAGGNDTSVSITASEGSGIEICSGKLIVNCGTVYGGYEYTGTNDELLQGYRGHSGSAGIGDAITVIGRRADGYDTASLSVVINGGTFQSNNNYGLRYFDCNLANENQISQTAEVEITDGTFAGAAGAVDFKYVKADEQQIIAGGNFSSQLPVEYLAKTLTAELYSRSNPDAPYSYYPSVAAAQAAAQPGDVITDLTNVAPGAADVTITFDYSNGSVSTVDSKVGATVNLPTPTRNGYTFGGWRVNNSSTVVKGGTSYTVTADTTFTAIWNAINIPDTYDIELIVGEGGEAKASYSNASAGTTITITVAPDEGYELDYITVDGERISGTTFKMPDHDVTVRVYFTDGTSALPFTDVSANQWFYDAISYVYTNGMMEGDSATTFNPDGRMTRAMFWAVLGRIDGATITGANWVETARSWAMAEGVSDGTNPNDYVTREMMVTMLWRYAGEPASEESLSAYTDAASVSDWAAEAMSWALETGVIEGVTATTLQPQGTATRAQCATIFMRYDALVA